MSNQKGLWLGIEKRPGPDELEVTFHVRNGVDCRLHWGTAQRRSGAWQIPDESLWPAGTIRHSASAVQTPFHSEAEQGRLTVRFPMGNVPPFLVFDVFSPRTNQWENNRGQDFWVELAEPGPAPAALLEAKLAGAGEVERISQKVVPLAGDGELAVAVVRDAQDAVQVWLVTDVPGPVQLHWGLQKRSRAPWTLPPASVRPARSMAVDERAVRSTFDDKEGARWLILDFPAGQEPGGIGVVLFQPENERWLKPRGGDLFLKIPASADEATALSGLMEAIVDGEMGEHGWTLMHRFNLCHDLMGEVGDDRDAWATLFVWLRYSAVRQLDWQRNYNTKPRELAHAQDRLTARLAQAFADVPAQRDLIRAMLGCVGRGGDGQRIRDDILHIMHRHHIKEVGGTWMEQWHQKLHNNTTPDDIVICEAYLAFLRSDGNLDAYEATLLEGGVTRERLESFERPIRENPEWHPHLKDGLIHDFGEYLTLLRSVHSGTDLHVAADAGAYLLEGAAREALGFVQWHFRNPSVNVLELITRLSEARRGLWQGLASESNVGRLKDGLYLDLALEEGLRTAIERQLQARFNQDELLALIDQVLSNLVLVQPEAELEQCRREWAALPEADRFAPEWCLRAKATVDRLRRAVEAVTDQAYQLLQPKAEQLGKAFEAETWSVSLFSEEVVRGRPVFVLSMLLHHLDPILRRGARLGDWQVVSPREAVGEVKVVADLRSLQGKRFDQPTVLIVDRVDGDEEPPDGVRAVLTSRSVDLVSHVAVRARNAGLLFATCYDEATFTELKKLDGKRVEVSVTGDSDVKVGEALGEAPARPRRRKASRPKIALPKPSLRVLTLSQFDPKQVGGKSWRLKEMAGKMPPSVRTPRSVALPFRVFDAVLAESCNKAVAARSEVLMGQVAQSPEQRLAELRACIQQLEVPGTLLRELADALESEGFGPLGDSALVARRLKEVWASLWNDRAYFSRQTNGLAHDDVSMAVLVQEVVRAEYAFVIHTVNPATLDPDEIYAEVVCGLGETLVGNHPGRALSVVIHKQTGQANVTAYPSKSSGLFGGGLIFRSDSNAEDLEGYAGAGLYDSVLLEPPVERRLDYTAERLVNDSRFQSTLFQGIGKLAIELEKVFDGPQDIEGAWGDDVFYVVQTRPQVGT